ncbi:hypothetical protein NMY3_03561 [Candidatus Nitrosocosmicus oleophilus]|uniref:Uncharacterized protein n=1 Tax=Candidatus Nitrosocosmicus oleophilus TaxID=1353260 RepID=A0A654M4Q4_9ARCH|nr:hypothetical protein NMY3_03561 [Candidatus Nitrosocosmicus oleophilus]
MRVIPSQKLESIKRPGRDSNPGQGSDSPPYWTGLYNAINAFLYYPGTSNFIITKTN